MLRFTIYGCINLLVWDVLLPALHLIGNAPPKEDILTCLMGFKNVVYYCEINVKSSLQGNALSQYGRIQLGLYCVVS